MKPQTFKLFNFRCDLNESSVLYQAFVTNFPFLNSLGRLGVLPSSTLSLSLFCLFSVRGLLHDLLPEIFHVEEDLLLALILIPQPGLLSLVVFASFSSCSECYCEKVCHKSDFHRLEVTGCHFLQS